MVWFKGHSANQYHFTAHSDGTYTSSPGVLAELSEHPGSSIRYTLTTPAQGTYEFDVEGKLLTWSEARGKSFTYICDELDRLVRVTGPSGQRGLSFSYGGQGRISAVSDHAGCEVSFTDVLGEV